MNKLIIAGMFALATRTPLRTQTSRSKALTTVAAQYFHLYLHSIFSTS